MIFRSRENNDLIWKPFYSFYLYCHFKGESTSNNKSTFIIDVKIMEHMIVKLNAIFFLQDL